MKKLHFYDGVVCMKVRGGKHSLWHCRFRIPSEGNGYLCGAGNTADNAIKDLQNQCRNLYNKRFAKAEISA